MTIIILPSCGEPEPDHEQLLSEIGENNRIKNEKRKEFMESEIYKTASLYIDSTLEDCFPDHEYEFTLEPGTFYNTELPAYSDFSENEVTRNLSTILLAKSTSVSALKAIALASL